METDLNTSGAVYEKSNTSQETHRNGNRPEHQRRGV